MNEGTKTGVFWGIAVVMLVIAALVAWPKSSDEGDTIAGQMLFEKFTDPLAAASMKIVTFDEEQGQLETFEVRKERDTDLWTIPSRDSYPADALEQMKNAANSLVGLKILDIQTSNAEDHDDLGVVEPKLEDLEVGDEGVGRLVTFKNDSQEPLAALIIGDALKDDSEKRYVRVPGQDPVYVVKLDESPLTTNFQDWIEDDLLQLSSIDIADIEIKDYNASLNLGGQISLTRNYAATVKMDGSQWSLENLVEYDPKKPMVDPAPVEVGPDEKLNKAKLDAMKNALDDLKIADVVRKPEGMSANLRANQDLLADNEAIGSLAQRGFYPVPSGRNGEVEILSANGELSVSLKEGVKYVMRFGNIAGVSDKQEAGTGDETGEEVDAGVNRYLLVTTIVDESKFPPPELKSVPQTLEELDAILNPKEEKPADDKASSAEPEMKKEPEPSEEKEATEEPKPAEPAEKKDASADEAKEGEAKEGEAKQAKPAEESVEAKESEPTGETDSSGSGEATGSGEAQEPSAEASQDEAKQDQPKQDEAKQDEVKQDEVKQDEVKLNEAKQGEPKQDEAKPADDAAAKSDVMPKGDEKASDPKKAADEELTDEEKQERLEAEQEKITKENQRKLDERKDKLEAAERRVRELNARFADWYYVIPEDTYSKLRIKRDELFEKPGAEEPEAPGVPGGPPQFNFPGLPGN